MRYKNLTITITLGCLSIVALVGLVILPISNGICEWSGEGNYKTFSNSSVGIEQGRHNDMDSWSKDTRMGRGWWINASLNATGYGADARVSPSIYGIDPDTGKPEAFNRNRSYGGTANVCASRADVTYENCIACGETHILKGDAKSNADRQKSIWAKVVEGTEKIDRMYGREISTETGHLVGSSITAKTEVPFGSVEADLKYEWTRSDGKKFQEYHREVDTVEVVLLGDTEGQEETVGKNMIFCWGDYHSDYSGTFISMPAETNAGLSFNIGDDDNSGDATPRYSSGNRVTYNPEDDEPEDDDSD